MNVIPLDRSVSANCRSNWTLSRISCRVKYGISWLFFFMVRKKNTFQNLDLFSELLIILEPFLRDALRKDLWCLWLGVKTGSYLSLQMSRANPKLGAQIERTEIAVIRNKQAINTIAREIWIFRIFTCTDPTVSFVPSTLPVLYFLDLVTSPIYLMYTLISISRRMESCSRKQTFNSLFWTAITRFALQGIELQAATGIFEKSFGSSSR